MNDLVQLLRQLEAAEVLQMSARRDYRTKQERKENEDAGQSPRIQPQP